jgi:N-acetylneuraminate synthase
MGEVRLGQRLVSDETRPYLIAEIGVNHGGSLELAKRLIELAKEGGADAAKFQTYKAAKLASVHSPAYWDTTKETTTSQFQLFQKYDSFGPREYQELAAHCASVGIEFLSTPFDDEAVELLAPLVPFFKIASADLTTVPLLRRIAAKGKPVVLSTGASELSEINSAIDTLREAGCRELVLLHCVLNYPTADKDAHLNMITGLRESYPEYVVGYSDHTLPDGAMTTLTTAYLKGARVLEKHFTHDPSLSGNDHYHAMTADDCRRFWNQVDKIRALEGAASAKSATATEDLARKHARRSIVINVAVKRGVALSEAHLTYKRPASGISPVEWDRVVGRRAARDLPEDHVLQWEDLTG